MKRAFFSFFLLLTAINCWTQQTASNTNKKRVTYSDGSYADITYNTDGSTTTVRYSVCNICHGLKICSSCGGAGGYWSGYGNYSTYHLCRSCGGDARCKYCFGTGMSVFTTTYYPNSNTTIGKDLWSGNIVTSKDPHENKRSSSQSSKQSSNTTKSQCSTCRGTGLDPMPTSSPGVGGWIGIFHNGKSMCKYCKKYESHWHDKCPHCNVPKY